MAQPYIVVNVAGVNRTAYVCQPDAAPALEWSEALRERKTLALSFISLDGSWFPARGQHITFEFIADAIPLGSPEGLLFGGYITDVDRRKVAGSDAIISTTTCVSYEQIMDRRRAAAETYIGQVAGGIFNDIGANSLIGEGFFYETETGPTIPEFRIQEPRPTVRQTWDKLADLSSVGADKYYWDVSAAKQIRFFKQDTYPAPFTITDALPYVLGTEGEFASVNETNQGIVNRVWVYVGQYLRPVETENFAGDGSTQIFDLPFAAGAPPQISVDGIDVGDFVGIEGETGKQWYWALGSTRIRQDDAGVVLTGANILSVTYQGLDRRAVGPFDAAASASAEGVLQGDGTGVYESYLEIDTPQTSTDVDTAAQAFLDRFKTATVTFRGATFTPGLRSGQELTVNLTDLNINLSMLIQSVTLRDHGGGHFLWSFTAIFGAARDDWKRALVGQDAATGVTGIGAGGAGPPPVTGGTAPAAPNLDATWLSGLGTWTHVPLRRKIVGDIDVTFGYTGVITPPVDAPALRQIHITRISPAGDRLPLGSVVGPFPQGGPHTFRSGAVDYDFTGVFLEFACENAAGQITANPYTVEITGAPPTGAPPVDLPVELGVSAFEVAPRHVTEMRGLVLTLGIIPVFLNPAYPCTITIWTTRPLRRGESAQSRARPGIEWRGWHDLQDPGTFLLGALGTSHEFDIWAPTSGDELWTVTFALGKHTSEAPIPQSAKTSAPFLVLAPAVPATQAATGAYIDELIVGAGNKRGMFGWSNMFTFLPFDDPEFVTARWTTQNGHIIGGNFVGGGQHDGAEKVMGDLDDPTVHRLEGTNLVTRTNKDALWDVPDYRLEDGTINPNNVFRIRLYISSRNDQFGTGGTWTLQECWSSDVGVSTPGTEDHQDIVLDLQAGRPMGANLAESSADGQSHKIPSLVIKLSADNTINIDAIGNIHVNQPALVIGNMSGDLTIDRISDINNIIIADLTGNIDVNRIDQLHTWAIGNFTGQLDIFRIANIDIFSIDAFGGTISIAKIRDLGTFNITNFTGNLDIGRINNFNLLFISQFQGNLHVSRVDSITALAIASFQGNLSFTRVDQLTSLNITDFQGSITVDRISNLGTFAITNFTGNLNFTRVDNITNLNIGSFSGTINFFNQAGDFTIPINKLQTLFVQTIQGWDGAQINVGGSGLRLLGSGQALQIVGGGSIFVSPGHVDAQFGYKIFFNTVIDAGRNAFFADLTTTGNIFAAGEAGITGSLNVMNSSGGAGIIRFARGICVATSNV